MQVQRISIKEKKTDFIANEIYWNMKFCTVNGMR